MFRIWDYLGTTNNLLINRLKLAKISGDEIAMDWQIYVLSSTIINDEKGKKEDLNLFSPQIGIDNGTSAALGLSGLRNLGYTCYMNSAIQCLSHTPKLNDYFLGRVVENQNIGNEGRKDELAAAFEQLLSKLWAPRATPVTPKSFRSTMCRFAPQFSGNNQHDSQEFLSFLLNGLHEDLNRVKSKPQIVQTPVEDGRPDEQVADEHWAKYTSSNDSIITDLFYGQLRSTLACPVCNKSSIKFSAFMDLPLPLLHTPSRKMTLTVLTSDGNSLLQPVTVFVPEDGSPKDLVVALSKACSLKDNEKLLIAEMYNSSMIRFLDDGDSIKLIKNGVQLAAYRLPKDMDGSDLAVTYETQGKSLSIYFPSFKKFGIPLMSRISDFSKGSEMHKEPALMSKLTEDPITLSKCVDAFLKAEPLGTDNEWYCPNCKESRQAINKIDLWRLPEILTIHLKRYTKLVKLETFVDFPLDDFDLSDYVIPKNNSMRHRYMLYAVINHYGDMDTGHYTAFVKHKMNTWYVFDDSHVSQISKDKIKTSAAYVLFYKRM